MNRTRNPGTRNDANKQQVQGMIEGMAVDVQDKDDSSKPYRQIKLLAEGQYEGKDRGKDP